MVNQGTLRFFLSSRVNVTTVGSDPLLKLLYASCFVCLLSACTEAPLKEYFCEAYPQEGESLIYKQQIVQLGNDSMCLLGATDLHLCGIHNQNATTPWHLQDSQTEFRETLNVKLNKDWATMAIDQESRLADKAQGNTETTHVYMLYEFQKRAGTLNLTIGQGNQPTVYTCKPWTKRAWWHIY